MTTKIPKSQRRNIFIMGAASTRAMDFARGYLRKHAVVPEGATLDDDQFKFAMDAAIRLALAAYAQGLGDALDAEDGKPLAVLP